MSVINFTLITLFEDKPLGISRYAYDHLFKRKYKLRRDKMVYIGDGIYRRLMLAVR